MATEVVMPALGVAQDTGKLLRWLKAEGEPVAAGEPVMEVETDKVTVEVEAPATGTLAGVRVREGEEVPVGHVLAWILSPGEAVPGGSPGDAGARAAATRGRPAASPRARRLAEELGVDLAQVVGTGPGGAVTEADVEAAASRRSGALGRSTAIEPPAAAGEEEAVEIGPRWRRMAERMAASWSSAPHFFLFREAEASGLVEVVRELRRRGEAEPTYTDVVVKAAAVALRKHPEVNVRWEGGRLVRGQEVNVGLAVAVPDGLVVPVLHRADQCSVAEVARWREEVVGRAMEGTLGPPDVAGGTFTVTNLGMHGVDAFAPVLNPPQAAILAVGRVAERVVAVDGAPAVRPTVTVTLGCDHRALDGVRAARFLETLVSLLEDPWQVVE